MQRILCIDIHVLVQSTIMNCFLAADSSVNNTENLSPSLTPPPSAPSKSPQSHQTYVPKDGNESDDDHEIIEEDDEDSTEGRNTENASPNSLQNKRKKKTRTVFSRAQVFQLESTFDLKRLVMVKKVQPGVKQQSITLFSDT